MSLWDTVKNIAPAIGATLGGGIIGSNLYGANEDRRAQERANEQNIASAREQTNFQREMVKQQTDFQERMANTSYQRAMKDMEQAGLNPMLAFSQGGASTPSGATASGAMSTVQPASQGAGRAISKGIGEIASTAMGAMNLSNQTTQTKSTVGLQSAQAVNQQASAEQAQANIKKIEFDKLKTQAETTKTLQDAKQSAETFEDRKNLIKIEREMQETEKKWQEPEKYINNGSKVVGAVTDAVGGMVKGFLKPTVNGNSAKRPPPSSRTKNYYDAKGEHRGTIEEKWNYPNY